MTTYDPLPGVHVGRPACANCGAAFRLHRDGASCPVAARVDSLTAALDVFRSAIRSGDAARIFAARGDVQRLGGDPDAAILAFDNGMTPAEAAMTVVVERAR